MTLVEASDAEARYVGWFHDLDAWTEYWDVYHPETRGRFYFGDGDQPGLLSHYLPSPGRPAVFRAWSRIALSAEPERAAATESFVQEVRVPSVADAVLEVDELLDGLFNAHFGPAELADVQQDYFEAMHRFATDSLPPASERAARIPAGDPRKRTAGRHTLDGDLMWFGWALHLQAAELLRAADGHTGRRTLMLAGVAIGCPTDFVHRGHRRTRTEYVNNPNLKQSLLQRAAAWADDFAAAEAEVRALYRIREWGD